MLAIICSRHNQIRNKMAIRLDRTDRQILDILVREGRISNQELAERVSLSPSPCLRRLRRLEESGVIRHYAAVLEPALVGMGLLAYVNVRVDKQGVPGQPERGTLDMQFATAVQQWPEVVECHAMTGDLDYLLRVQVADLDHFSRFMMDTLMKQPGVLDVRSSLSLRSIK